MKGMGNNKLYKVIAAIAFVVFVVIFAKPIVAQETSDEFNFEKAYQDYIFNYSEYEKLEDVYQLKRSEYLRYQTLSSKTEAETATRAMLKERDEVVITYLTALRTKIAEMEGIIEKESKFSAIDDEVNWYKDHKNNLDGATSLEELVAMSDKVKDRYSDTETISYSSLNELSIGKLVLLRHPLSSLVNKTKDRVEIIKGSGDKETEFVQRWVIDAQNEITRSDKKVAMAREVISEIKPNDRMGKKRSIFLSAQDRLDESHQHLKEASRYLKEILLEIKTEDN
jgi:hypothetical protein